VLENIGQACYYFAVAAWLSNFFHGFSNPMGTLISKIESLKTARNLEI